MTTTVIPSAKGENTNPLGENMNTTTTSLNDIKLSIFDKFVGRTVEAGIAELPLIRLTKGWKNPETKTKIKLPDGSINKENLLSVEQARDILSKGWNVGCYGAPDGIEIHDIDLEDGKFIIPSDKLEELIETLDTLTIMTRSGGYDFIFKSSGQTKNSVIYYNGELKTGERRCFWQYAVCAGSFVEKDKADPSNGKVKGFTDNATGFYEIIRDVPIREFDPSKLPEWYKFAKNVETQKKKTTTTPTLSVTDEFIINKISSSKIGDEFNRLMRGDTSEYNGDRSAADMALANHIAFHTSDRKQIERLMTTPERLALNDKARRDTYLQGTIDKALENPDRVMYNPNYNKSEIQTIRDEILRDCPIVLLSTDKFDKESTITHITRIDTYNKIKKSGRELSYTSALKDGTFYALSFNELQACKDAGKKLSKEILEYERDFLNKQQAITTLSPDISDDTNVLKTYLDAFHVNSVSIDDEVATWVLLSYMGTRELNGDGLHLKLGAEQGTGKSHSVNASIHALPTVSTYKGAFTDKSLIYDKTLHPGKIIKLDEMKNNSDGFENFLKESISSYQDGMEYRTVGDVGGEKKTIMIPVPARLTYILLSVDGYGDEQTTSRFLPLSIAERGNKSITITDFRLNKRMNGQAKLHDNEKTELSRDLLAHFQDRTFSATIPFVRNIKYAITEQRVQEWFECAIMYSAVLNYKKRVHEYLNEDKTHIKVEASKEDFDFCIKLSLFKQKERSTYRLGEPEVKVIDALAKHNLHGKTVTVKMIQEITGYSGSRVSQIMHGRSDRGTNGGLMAKLGITEGSLSSSINTTSVDGFITVGGNHFNAKAYTIPDYLPAGNVDTDAIVEWVA